MNLDDILNIMSSYNLTCDEIMLVYLTFISQTESGSASYGLQKFEQWYKIVGGPTLKTLFESLKEKGIILKNYCPKSYIPDEIEFNTRFLKSYFKITGQLGKELWDAYPSYMILRGNPISLKNFTKKFTDLNELYFWYSTTIGHSIEKHYEILSILDWAKKHDLVNVSLVEFIGSHKWDEYKELKNKGIAGQVDTDDIYSLA